MSEPVQVRVKENLPSRDLTSAGDDEAVFDDGCGSEAGNHAVVGVLLHVG
jgi:hypothetical protein